MGKYGFYVPTIVFFSKNHQDNYLLEMTSSLYKLGDVKIGET